MVCSSKPAALFILLLCGAMLSAFWLCSLSARSLNGRLTAATRTNSDSLLSSARSPMEMSPASGVSPPMSTAVDPAVLAATAAAVNAAAAATAAGSGAFVHSSSNTNPAGMGSCQQQQAFLSQQQQSLQVKQLQMQHEQVSPAALASWQQQSMQSQDSMVHPHHQLFGIPPYQQQDRALPGLARMSEPGRHVLQQLQQQQPPFFIGGAGSHAGALPEQVTNPLVQQQQQQLSLERRSAPLDIPWQGNMVQPTAAGAAAAGMGTAMYARLTAQHQLGQLGSSPRFNSGNGMLSEAMGGSAGAAGSPGASMLAGQAPNGSFHGPHGTSSMPDVGFDVGSGPRYAAPRAPKALREVGMNRERRRSERRLSKGANIAWSTCQVINASELQMLECIGGGAYGQVRHGACAGCTSLYLQKLLNCRVINQCLFYSADSDAFCAELVVAIACLQKCRSTCGMRSHGDIVICGSGPGCMTK